MSQRALHLRRDQAEHDYLLLGPGRTLSMLAARYAGQESERVRLGRGRKPPCTSVGTLGTWSQEGGWEDRARAFDATNRQREVEREGEAMIVEARARTQQRLAMAAHIRAKAYEALQQITPDKLAKRPADIPKWLYYADATERTDYGQVTNRVEVSGPGGGPISVSPTQFNPDALSDSELEQFIELCQRAGVQPARQTPIPITRYARQGKGAAEITGAPGWGATGEIPG